MRIMSEPFADVILSRWMLHGLEARLRLTSPFSGTGDLGKIDRRASARPWRLLVTGALKGHGLIETEQSALIGSRGGTHRQSFTHSMVINDRPHASRRGLHLAQFSRMFDNAAEAGNPLVAHDVDVTVVSEQTRLGRR